MKHHYDTDPAIEPSHFPHMHRLWMGDRPTPVHLAVATQRDGTVRYLPTKPAPLMAEIDRSDAAEEGGTFREPPSAGPRVPRRMADMDSTGLGAALCIVSCIGVLALLAWGGLTLWGGK